MTRTPDTGFTFLCVAVTQNLVLMQWCVAGVMLGWQTGLWRSRKPGGRAGGPRYAPRKKFMKLKDFETPFDQPPALMELLVLPNEPLPVLCVGATRDKKSRDKALAIVNPNFTNEKVAQHMSAELGWVRVRAGREDIFATDVKQVGVNRFMLCFSRAAPSFWQGGGEG